MKKLVLTLTAMTLVSAGAFAQGKIGFTTDSLHLAYYDSTAGALAGSGVFTGNMPGTGALVADLYMGTSSGSLFLYSTTTFSAAPGKWNLLNVAANSNTNGAPSIANGSVFTMTQIRDSSLAPEASISGAQLSQGALAMAAQQGFNYVGWSQEFTFTLGTSVTYPTMFGANSGGTWATGTQNLDQYGVGSRGAIGVSAVPEPATFALAGLGAAGLMIFRRRKS